MAGGKARSVGLGGGEREGTSLFYAYRRDCSRDMFSQTIFSISVPGFHATSLLRIAGGRVNHRVHLPNCMYPQGTIVPVL